MNPDDFTCPRWDTVSFGFDGVLQLLRLCPGGVEGVIDRSSVSWRSNARNWPAPLRERWNNGGRKLMGTVVINLSCVACDGWVWQLFSNWDALMRTHAHLNVHLHTHTLFTGKALDSEASKEIQWNLLSHWLPEIKLKNTAALCRYYFVGAEYKWEKSYNQ